MNSFKKKSKKIKKKRDKKDKKDKKRRRRSSSSSSSSSSDSSISSSSSSSDSDKHKKRKHKKDHKRKKAKRCDEKSKDRESSKSIIAVPENQPKPDDDNDFSIPIHLMDNNHKKPETKEEYEKRQSILRRVVDEETGRTRLIKGDGEIIEEMVSKDRHKEINKQATQNDGHTYQNKMIGWAVTSNKK